MRVRYTPELPDCPTAARLVVSRARWLFAPLGDRLDSLTFSTHHNLGDLLDPAAVCARDALVAPERVAIGQPDTPDLKVFHDRTAWIAQSGRQRRQSLLDDPLVDVDNPANVIASVSDLAQPHRPNDLERLNAFLDVARQSGARAVIVGSGGYDPAEVDALTARLGDTAWPIYLGSTIFDADLTLRLPPKACLAWDLGVQLGPSSTGQAYRNRLFALAQSGTAILVPDIAGPLLSACWKTDLPEVVFRLRQAMDRHLKPCASPESSMRTIATDNVLTSVALPLARNLEGPIYTLGLTLPGQARDGWALAHPDEAAHQRALGPVRRVCPAFALSSADGYVSQHLSSLSHQIGALARFGHPIVGIEAAADTSMMVPPKIWEKELRRLIQVLDRAGTSPKLIAGLAGILVAGLAYGACQVMPNDWIIALSCGLAVTLLISLFFFVRLKIDRAAARIERRALMQIERINTNLSTRLEQIEHELSAADREKAVERDQANR